jgi:hypothetical protein
MGRQPETRPINPTVALFAAAQQRAAEDALPTDPDVLRNIIRALLKRVEANSLAEFKLLRSRIQIITGLVTLDDLDERARVAMLATCYLLIADEKPSKSEHNPETVQLQWYLLLKYLRQHSLGEVGSMPNASQLEELTQQLSHIPCKCPYRPIKNGLQSLQRWTERQNKKREKPMEDMRTHLSHHLLAALHNRTGPQKIRKLLSQDLDIRRGGTLDAASKKLHALIPVLQAACDAAIRQLSDRSRTAS